LLIPSRKRAACNGQGEYYSKPKAPNCIKRDLGHFVEVDGRKKELFNAKISSSVGSNMLGLVGWLIVLSPIFSEALNIKNDFLNF